MKFELLTFELPKKSWAFEVVEAYEKKINPFVPFKLRFLKTPAKSRKNASEAKKVSSQILRDALNPQALWICFDERGQSLNSLKFTKKLDQALESGKQKVQWIIGGPYGIEDDVGKHCKEMISLSPLVMNQEVALTVAMEQIYRAFTIRNNLPYHNE